jgi:hypothetical protein
MYTDRDQRIEHDLYMKGGYPHHPQRQNTASKIVSSLIYSIHNKSCKLETPIQTLETLWRIWKPDTNHKQSIERKSQQTCVSKNKKIRQNSTPALIAILPDLLI